MAEYDFTQQSERDRFDRELARAADERAKIPGATAKYLLEHPLTDPALKAIIRDAMALRDA